MLQVYKPRDELSEVSFYNLIQIKKKNKDRISRIKLNPHGWLENIVDFYAKSSSGFGFKTWCTCHIKPKFG